MSEFAHYEVEVAELAARRQTAPPPPGAVVLYGSSTLRLWPNVEDLAFPGLGLTLVNQAFGGSTLAACAHFFGRLVAPLQPAALVVYAGDNDLGDGRKAEDVIASWRRLRAQADALLPPPAPLLWISIKPSPARLPLLPAMRRVNRAVEEDLESRPGGRVADLFTPMLDAAGLPRAELFQADKLHLNDHGYGRWQEWLEPELRRLARALAATQPSPELRAGATANR